MKNLQINPPEGYEIDEKESTFSNIVFKPINRITPEQKMQEIWKKCTTFKYSLSNCRTYFMDNIPMIQQDWKNKRLSYSYSYIYSFFQNEFNLKEEEINKIVLSVISKDLNCEGLRAWAGVWVGDGGVGFYN